MKELVTGCIDINSEEYPLLLKEIPDAPKLLYYKGHWNPNYFCNTVGVVGSRRITFYGERATQKLVQELVSYDINIVSGFMYGVDYIAHSTALNSGGNTLAVLPCGVDLIMKYDQQGLYDNIIREGGLVLSEYPSTFSPRSWTFYKRNRIVAGLSTCLLVIEAGLDSGSLITANYAKKYKRKIYAVPGSIFSEYSLGTLQLIKDGAKPVNSGCDMAIDMGLEHNSGSLRFYEHPKTEVYDKLLDPNSLEYQIISIIKEQPKTLNEIVCQLPENQSLLSSKITLMLLNGCIYERDNKFFTD